jgi:hypothetical protein
MDSADKDHFFALLSILFVKSNSIAQNNIIILSKTHLLFQKYFVTLHPNRLIKAFEVEN